MFSVTDHGCSIHEAKLEGHFHCHVDLLVTKHNKLRGQLEDGNELILLNSFDEADVFKPSKRFTSVILFLSSSCSAKQIQSK